MGVITLDELTLTLYQPLINSIWINGDASIMVNSAGPAVDPSLAESEVLAVLVEPELTVVMPCLNEAETLADCIL